jgi:hypothetical protein
MFGLQPLTELPAFATALLGFNQAVILPYFQPESFEKLLRVVLSISAESSRPYRMHLTAASTAPW